jgi:acetyl-CoA acetyltransferase
VDARHKAGHDGGGAVAKSFGSSGAGMTSRQPYDGVVVCAPVTVPYVRYSTDTAHWWIGRALHQLTKTAGIRPQDIDGLVLSSFTTGADSAVGMTQHLGLSPRWLDHVPMGGVSGVVGLRRAARAVQNGDAQFVAVVAGDTNHVDSFRKTLSSFSRFAQDAVYPYGSGGANASFALITQNYMNKYGVTREDFGKICVAQRDNALSIPFAMMKKKLTLDEYMKARPISDPLHLFDCVMPCAGAEAFLVCREDVAKSLKLPAVKLLSTIERHNAFAEDPIQVRGGWAVDIDDLWQMAGVKPDDVDLLQTYDDYPVIITMQFEDLGFCKEGEGKDFIRQHTFTTDGSFPHNTSGGQLSTGQAGAAGGHLGITEAIRQLTDQPIGKPVEDANIAVVSGFGMINYDRGLSSGAAVLARAS